MNNLKKIAIFTAEPAFIPIAGYFIYKQKQNNIDNTNDNKDYSSNDLLEYTDPKNKVLISYKDNVYNITDFIKEHPGGGEKIMLAAGKAIDPYWDIYPQHLKNTEDILESMKVGKLSDYKPKPDNKKELYKNEPKREGNLKYHTSIPCNAEISIDQDLDYIIDLDDWYIRNHHHVPDINIKDYRLEIKNYTKYETSSPDHSTLVIFIIFCMGMFMYYKIYEYFDYRRYCHNRNQVILNILFIFHM